MDIPIDKSHLEKKSTQLTAYEKAYGTLQYRENKERIKILVNILNHPIVQEFLQRSLRNSEDIRDMVNYFKDETVQFQGERTGEVDYVKLMNKVSEEAKENLNKAETEAYYEMKDDLNKVKNNLNDYNKKVDEYYDYIKERIERGETEESAADQAEKERHEALLARDILHASQEKIRKPLIKYEEKVKVIQNKLEDKMKSINNRYDIQSKPFITSRNIVSRNPIIKTRQGGPAQYETSRPMSKREYLERYDPEKTDIDINYKSMYNNLYNSNYEPGVNEFDNASDMSSINTSDLSSIITTPRVLPGQNLINK